jgi:hypothetical protein
VFTYGHNKPDRYPSSGSAASSRLDRLPGLDGISSGPGAIKSSHGSVGDFVPGPPGAFKVFVVFH